MTGSIRNEVIDVYSRYTVLDRSLYGTDDYKRLCNKYNRDTAFDAVRNRVEMDKRQLEEQMSDQTRESQVRLALVGVFRRRAKRKEYQDSFVELVKRAYGRSWSNAQRTYFRRVSEYLSDTQDYFLSFTNRNQTPGTFSRVNEEHEFFIREIIRDYKNFDWSKRNLLAQAIHYLLQQTPLTGFFFPEHGRDSYEVIPELERECRRALVFIQVVQGVMFTQAPSYCYLEFNVANLRPFPNSVIFLDAEKTFLREDRVDPDLLPWYESVKAFARIALPLTDSYSKALIRRNRDLVNQRICELVNRAGDAIYDGVPAG
jgi:hypothetical protein